MILHLCVILFTGVGVGFPAYITGHMTRGSASRGICIGGGLSIRSFNAFLLLICLQINEYLKVQQMWPVGPKKTELPFYWCRKHLLRTNSNVTNPLAWNLQPSLLHPLSKCKEILMPLYSLWQVSLKATFQTISS